ncbi:hypothetical protein [Longimicrobium sp.]|uniref:hypothetical protein n=1 Tax=Longimicrobium sp. TaxID=2029185 RepID=UPI002E36DEC5|nr:hypothetical protein [Longimicrobium sp.]HEX6040073.1 hypothetical protein [Longimicrobium sp.]
MPDTSYSPLPREELDVLLAADEQETARTWNDLTVGLSTLLHLWTATYPRPLIPEATARQMIPEALQALRDTPFYPRALHNARVVEEIERQFREHGPRLELYRAVDDCIETMLEEWMAIEHYPDPPPALTSREPAPRVEPWRFVGAR